MLDPQSIILPTVNDQPKNMLLSNLDDAALDKRIDEELAEIPRNSILMA